MPPQAARRSKYKKKAVSRKANCGTRLSCMGGVARRKRSKQFFADSIKSVCFSQRGPFAAARKNLRAAG